MKTRVSEAMNRRGLNQIEFAARVGVQSAMISRIASGYARPGPHLAIRMAAELAPDVTKEDLRPDIWPPAPVTPASKPSFRATIWANERHGPNLAATAVLRSLAYFADKGNSIDAYPTVAMLAEHTCCDRKTVVTARALLIEAKLIEDSGKRRGETGQVHIYNFCWGHEAPQLAAAAE